MTPVETAHCLMAWMDDLARRKIKVTRLYLTVLESLALIDHYYADIRIEPDQTIYVKGAVLFIRYWERTKWEQAKWAQRSTAKLSSGPGQDEKPS